MNGKHLKHLVNVDGKMKILEEVKYLIVKIVIYL